MAAPRPVRVLHVIDGLGGGGSERWIFDIVRRSDPKRVQHRVTTFHPDLGAYPYAEPLRRLGAYRTAPGRSAGAVSRERDVSARSRGRLERGAQVAGDLPTGIYRMAREWRSFRPDVVHAHLCNGFVLGLGLAQVARRPLVHTIPCTIGQMLDAGFTWMPGVYRRTQSRVAHFFTAYPGELRTLGVSPRRIHEMRGVLDLREVANASALRSQQREEVRREIGAAHTAPIALSVGRLHRSKGHDLGARAIALAAQHVPDLRWIVLGEGEEHDALAKLIAELGIGARTHLLGFKTDVLRYYAAADIYLRTAVLEAENLSSYQAMGMGLPVVGFDSGTGTELLRVVGHGRLVPNGDALAFGTAIADVLGSDDHGAALGARGREFAIAELDIGRTIDELVRTYEELAGGSGGGA